MFTNCRWWSILGDRCSLFGGKWSLFGLSDAWVGFLEYFYKSTKKSLAWVRPPSLFWQCPDFESSEIGSPSLTISSFYILLPFSWLTNWPTMRFKILIPIYLGCDQIVWLEDVHRGHLEQKNICKVTKWIRLGLGLGLANPAWPWVSQFLRYEIELGLRAV